MSRVGKNPVPIPPAVTVQVAGDTVTVQGPKGTLARRFHPYVSVAVADGQAVVTRKGESQFHRSLHGLTRALVQNMVVGVTQGYERALSIVGVGYKAELSGKRLALALGYSHPILFKPPEGITLAVTDQTRIVVRGIDKELVGEVAAKLRALRPPEPYKGKGIRYADEEVRRKAGKTTA